MFMMMFYLVLNFSLLNMTSWWLIWSLMEIASWTFYLMNNNNNLLGINFIIWQSFAGIMMIFFVVFMMKNMLVLCLMFKAAYLPFHLWFFMVAKYLSWSLFLIFIHINKISFIFFLFNIFLMENMVMFYFPLIMWFPFVLLSSSVMYIFKIIKFFKNKISFRVLLALTPSVALTATSEGSDFEDMMRVLEDINNQATAFYSDYRHTAFHLEHRDMTELDDYSPVSISYFMNNPSNCTDSNCPLSNMSPDALQAECFSSYEGYRDMERNLTLDPPSDEPVQEVPDPFTNVSTSYPNSQ